MPVEKVDFRDDLTKSASILLQGGVVLVNTELGWCYIADRSNPLSVQKLVELSTNTLHKDLILILENAHALEQELVKVPPIAWDLLETSDNKLILSFDVHQYRNFKNTPSLNIDGFAITNDRFMQLLIQKCKKRLLAFIPHALPVLEASELLHVVAYNKHKATKQLLVPIIQFDKNECFKILRK